MKTAKVLLVFTAVAILCSLFPIRFLRAGIWNTFIKPPASLTSSLRSSFVPQETGSDTAYPAPSANSLPPPARAFDPSQGSIHVFARCLNERNEAVLCHWQGPPGGSLWGAGHWFHQLPMRADSAPLVAFNKVADKIGIVTYVNDGGNGSVHGMSCDVSSFQPRSIDFSCGPEEQMYRERNISAAIVSTPPLAPGNPPEWAKFEVVFNMRGRLTGFASWLNGHYQTAREDASFYEPGLSCEGGQIQLTPTNLLMQNASLRNQWVDEYFAVAPGNRILHSWFVYPNWACNIFPVTESNGIITSAPKAVFGVSGEKELYALGADYRPYRWTLTGGEPRSERIADIQASMNIGNFLGVAITKADQTSHVFFRKNGSGTVIHVYKKSGGAWVVGNPEGVTQMTVLDAPTAVTDEEGNIHLFVGEWNGPNLERAGGSRAYLHHFVKAAGSNHWAGETLFSGNVQHTDGGMSAATAIFVSADGDTTEANIAAPGQSITPGASNPATASSTSSTTDLGVADTSKCQEGYLYQRAPLCDPIVGTTDRGQTITEAYACNWRIQMDDDEAHAAGRCPANLNYIEYGPENFACQGACAVDVDHCPAPLGGGCNGGYATAGTYYCAPLGYSGPCAGGAWRPIRGNQHLPLGSGNPVAYQQCCVK